MFARPIIQAMLAVALALGIAVSGAVLPVTRVSAASTIHLSRSNIPAGGTVAVSGFGFAPDDLVSISSDVLSGGKIVHLQSNTISDGNGAFVAFLTFPRGTQQGTYVITARDLTGHAAAANIHILPTVTIVAGSTPRSLYVIPTHQFWVNATGFAPNEAVTFHAAFPLYNGNTTVINRSVQTNAAGDINGAVFTTPRDAKLGTVTLTAAGATSKKTGSATLHVVYRPSITLNPSTARPGTSVHVGGHEFVPGSSVVVSAAIVFANGASGTMGGQIVVADGNGNFGTSVSIPSTARLGTYTVVARDVNHPSIRATAPLHVSVNPTIKLTPPTIYPGESFTASGSNFGSGSTVHVRATFNTAGGSRLVHAATTAGGNGNYSVTLRVPADTRPGTYTVTAQTVNASVHAKLQVNPRPTPVPTATATVPPTNAPVPTATPKPHKTSLSFRYTSIWYHWMRPGTKEHVIVQATLQTQLGIWVNVWYPGGQHQAWYQNTDNFGYWSKWFTVPYHSATSRNRMVLITFRLWHGKDNVKNFKHFGIAT